MMTMIEKDTAGQLADDVAAILTEEIDLAKQGSREEFAYLESQVPLIAQKIAAAAIERCREKISGGDDAMLNIDARNKQAPLLTNNGGIDTEKWNFWPVKSLQP